MLCERGMSMGVYRDLLFSAGGGINCKDQMEVQDDCATIAIGLGGTGIKCLKNLKRQVYDRVQPDNPDGTIPTYNKIKFLAVDWDRGSMAEDGKINQLDLEKEFFDLRIRKSITFGKFLSEEVLKNPSMYEWLKIRNLCTGESGISYLPSQLHTPEFIRQLGRVLIIKESKKFVEKIQRLILSVIEETKSSNSNVNIHVFTGMGGATGSGIFLDICYLIREAIRRVVPERKVTILGYFFLPDVNLSIPEIQKSKIISDFIQVNGFAAMKELDYCMNFEDNGGSWDQQYQGFHIGPSSKPPVDIPYLISGMQGMDNGFDHAMNIVSEFVLQAIIKNPIFNEEDIMGLKKLEMQHKVTNGVNRCYWGLEASSIIIPVKKAMADYEGIMDWRATYKKNYTIGRHIYERTQKDLRDWRSLFDLVPYSRDNQPTEWLKDQSRLYDKAVNLCIIKQNPKNIYEYQIVTTPNYKELLEKIDATMKEQNLEKLISLKKEARLAIKKKQSQDLLTIGGDVLEGYECTVVKDYVMASNEKMKLIVEELDKREKLENSMSEIQQEIDRIKKEEIDKAIKLKKYEEDKQIYFNALMAGVIRFNGKVRIVYSKKDDEGKSYEIEMTNYFKMHPFGGMVPVYQGFLTFSEFDKKDKEEIVKLTNLKKSKPKYVLDTIDQLWTIFTPEFVGTMQQLCRVFQPQEENKIKEFLRQFLKGLKEESKKLNR